MTIFEYLVAYVAILAGYDKNGEIVGKIVNGVQTIENSLQIIPKLEVDAPN